MNIQVKYVLLVLIFYVIVKILIYSKETFQTATTATTGTVPTISRILTAYNSDNIMSINDNSVTYLENNIFNLGKKVSVTKDGCPISVTQPTTGPTTTGPTISRQCETITNNNIENNVDKINAKRLCIIEGNDIECIEASQLGNALKLPTYRKNSVCIDGSCLNNSNINILKSMTPSGRSNPEVQNKNSLLLKSADERPACFANGTTRAHTCASHTSKLTVTRADWGNPNASWGWGQNLTVGGNTKKKDGSTYVTGVACGSRFAADAYVWDGNNNSSGCTPYQKHIGNKNSQAVVDLPLGKYYAFRPGFHKGTDELDQHCCWTDKFKFTLSDGQKIGGIDMHYKTMLQDHCNDETSKITFEDSKGANKVLMVNGSIDGPSGPTRTNAATSIHHHP